MKNTESTSVKKNGVPLDIYYFLLDWKDNNLKEFQEMKGERRLCDLSPNELHLLYRAIKAEDNEKNVVVDLLEGEIEQDNPNLIYVSIQVEDSRQSRFEDILENKGIKYYLSRGLFKVNSSEENIKTLCRENDIHFSFTNEYIESN